MLLDVVIYNSLTGEATAAIMSEDELQDALEDTGRTLYEYQVMGVVEERRDEIVLRDPAIDDYPGWYLDAIDEQNGILDE
jgi:hypothetical protein